MLHNFEGEIGALCVGADCRLGRERVSSGGSLTSDVDLFPPLSLVSVLIVLNVEQVARGHPNTSSGSPQVVRKALSHVLDNAHSPSLLLRTLKS